MPQKIPTYFRDFLDEFRLFKTDMESFKSSMINFQVEMYEFRNETREELKAINRRLAGHAKQIAHVSEDVTALEMQP